MIKMLILSMLASLAIIFLAAGVIRLVDYWLTIYRKRHVSARSLPSGSPHVCPLGEPFLAQLEYSALGGPHVGQDGRVFDWSVKFHRIMCSRCQTSLVCACGGTPEPGELLNPAVGQECILRCCGQPRWLEVRHESGPDLNTVPSADGGETSSGPQSLN